MPTSVGPALTCRPLADFAVHLFTTRHWRLGSRDVVDEERPGWEEVAQATGVPLTDLVRVRQVHGAGIVFGRSSDTEQHSEADIVVCCDPDLSLAVQTADCVPLLLVDRRTGAVAAAHAGWRGLAARVPAVAIKALAARFGSRPADLLAAVGPSIGPCCYEVGGDVRERFDREGFRNEGLTSWFLEQPASSVRNPSLERLGSSIRSGRWFLDMWAATCAQVSAAGVPSNQTFLAGLCTASHPDTFCSYRRDGRSAGRMAAAIRGTSHGQV